MKLIFVMLLVLVNAKQKIAIIDTGYGYKDAQWSCGEDRDYTGTGIEDKKEHGQYINEIINNGLSKDFCIINYKYDTLNTSMEEKYIHYIHALQDLTKVEHLKYVNISISGPRFSESEYKAIKILVENGVNVVVAAGNNSTGLYKESCDNFPACYSFYFKTHFFVVGGIDDNGSRLFNSNYGDSVVGYWEKGYYIVNKQRVIRGTSFAVPRYIKRLIGENNE